LLRNMACASFFFSGVPSAAVMGCDASIMIPEI
jgi:hypothetical protein